MSGVASSLSNPLDRWFSGLLPMAGTISLLCGVCLLGFSLIQLLFTVLS